MSDLKDKVAVITGGAKGIGVAVVRSFLAEGAKFVAFIDVDEDAGILLEQELLRNHRKEVIKFFKCDVTKDEELFSVFNYAVTRHGRIDVVVNNAGIVDEVRHKREIEVNFTALVTSSLKALEIMRKDQGGTGRTIINISSIGALDIQKHPTIYVYCATKSAVLMFSANLGMEAYYKQSGVRILTMCFGLTVTDIVNDIRGIDELSTATIQKALKDCKIQSPEAAAAGVVEAYKKGKSGSTWLVEGGEITDITERITKAYQIMSAAT